MPLTNKRVPLSINYYSTNNVISLATMMPIISFSEYDYLVKNFSYYESNI